LLLPKLNLFKQPIQVSPLAQWLCYHRSDQRQATADSQPSSCLEDLLSCYNSTLSDLLNNLGIGKAWLPVNSWDQALLTPHQPFIHLMSTIL